MDIGIIGTGAIGGYVREHLLARGHTLGALLTRPERVAACSEQFASTVCVGATDDLPDNLDLMIDCAGPAALATHGPAILRRGTDLLTVSVGALADASVHDALEHAAAAGGARLHLATGAIGALDCLRAANIGQLRSVRYTGRKPPQGWRGSPAEQKIDLDNLNDTAQVHFAGTARAAALAYPKNANVAAAVALAGVGMDNTAVTLIADPNVTQNIHEVVAAGDFGEFSFQITGNALPDNPKSSALAAMSVVSRVEENTQRIGF